MSFAAVYIQTLNSLLLFCFWLIWFIKQRALYNHALFIIVGIGIIIIGISAHLPMPQKSFIFCIHIHGHMSPAMHIKYLMILTCSF